jgi:hypothetical protein
VLPDGIFSNQKYQFGKILDGRVMTDGAFLAILSILQSNGKLYSHLLVIWYFSRFGML